MNASVKISLAVTGVLGHMTRYRDYPTRTFNSRYLDEFVAVLSDCGIASATQIAERLRRAVADHRFQGCGDPGLPVTVSIGVAGFPNHLSQDAVAVART